MTADVCSFSRLLVYNYATARNGVCDDASLVRAFPGNSQFRCQQIFKHIIYTPRQLLFVSLYTNYATWGTDNVTMYRSRSNTGLRGRR